VGVVTCSTPSRSFLLMRLINQGAGRPSGEPQRADGGARNAACGRGWQLTGEYVLLPRLRAVLSRVKEVRARRHHLKEGNMRSSTPVAAASCAAPARGMFRHALRPGGQERERFEFSEDSRRWMATAPACAATCESYQSNLVLSVDSGKLKPAPSSGVPRSPSVTLA